MYPRFPPKFLIGTMFGEISGAVTERAEKLAQLFRTAQLPYTMNKDMKAYLITHSVSDIALLSVLHSDNKNIDEKTFRTRKTAHQITSILKTNLRAIQQAGVAIHPSVFKFVLICPDLIMDFLFMLWLRTNMVKDMLLPDYADSATKEIVQLNNDLLKFLSQHEVTL